MTLDVASALWLPVAFVGAAAMVARRQLAHYRRARDERDDVGIFVFSRARLRRRLVGAGVLAAVGLTLFAYEIVVARAARSHAAPDGAGAIVIALLAEVGLLVAIAIADLRETAARTPRR